MINNFSAVRWVGGVEIEIFAIATGARIVPRFEEITPEKLGHAGFIKKMSLSTWNDRVILIHECKHLKAVTIHIRSGSRTICDGARRCLHDSICVVRNIVLNNNVVGGWGVTEFACSISVAAEAEKIKGVE